MPEDVSARWSAIAHAAEGAGDVDTAIGELFALPAAVPGRSHLAAMLLTCLLRAGRFTGLERMRAVDGLLALADQDPPATAQWRQTRAAARAAALLRAAAEQQLGDPRAALRELDELREQVGDGPAAAMLQPARLAIETLRALREGDEVQISNLPLDAERLRPLMANVPGGDDVADVLAEAMKLMAIQRQGGDIVAQLERLTAVADRLPPEHQMRAALAQANTMIAPFRQLIGDDGAGTAEPVPDAALAAMEAHARNPALTDPDRATSYAMIAGALLRAGAETDLGRVNRGIEWLRRAVALDITDDLQRAVHLQGLALGLFRRSELTGSTADLDEAGGVLKRAREHAGGPHHPQWAPINDMLGYVQRRRGGRDTDSRETTLDGLRAHLWQVLVQSDLAAASRAARDAADDAVRVARGFLLDNDPAGAIAALDAGRGLALFAATEVRTVTDRLRETGHDELADRWAAANAARDPQQPGPGQLSGELRHEVLTVLAERTSAGRLLDAPDLGEIRDALATLDADALVYLVAGEGVSPGFAVTAPRSGPPGFIGLPNLLIDDDQDVELYLQALDARDLTAVPGPSFPERLATLCDWAWRAAIGPLLDRYLPTVLPPDLDRPPRVVLIPMGQLARVPWQAARRGDGTYAVQLAAFSQAPSARILCRAAAAEPVPITPVGLVVGDPQSADDDVPALESARVEAYAVQQSFYRGGRYVGRRPDGSTSPSGAGTKDEVTAWLTNTAPGAGGVLHLACHGVVDPAGGTSYLLLAGDTRLSSEELIGWLDTAPDRAIALVVLAACRTAHAISGYDEAYSLGTAFLAGGARTVLSTQWRIPDRDTSTLMYLFHHHLTHDRVPVWEALRRAQLWMLDPAREIPAGMPGRLRAELDRTDPAAVVSWAGFVHSGQ